jgi:hypothetical protein
MKSAKPLCTEVRCRALATAAERLRDAQVVVLSGPRAVGKSTVLRTLAAELGREVVDLDNPATAQAFTADPMRFLDRPRPVLIDEYAKAPESLDLVKALLNRDGAPGQFLLAGSTRYGSVPAIAQALTGRAQIVPVLPLSQGEITETTESFVEELVRGRTPALADSGLDRAAYADRVLRGGMPMALRIAGEGARQRWFDQYLQLTLDNTGTAAVRPPARDVRRQRDRQADPLAGRAGRGRSLAHPRWRRSRPRARAPGWFGDRIRGQGLAERQGGRCARTASAGATSRRGSMYRSDPAHREARVPAGRCLGFAGGEPLAGRLSALRASARRRPLEHRRRVAAVESQVQHGRRLLVARDEPWNEPGDSSVFSALSSPTNRR